MSKDVADIFQKYAEAGVRKDHLPEGYEFEPTNPHPDLLLLIYQRFIYHPPFDPVTKADAAMLNGGNTVLVNTIHEKPGDDLWDYVFDKMVNAAVHHDRINMILNADAVPLLLNYPEKTDRILDFVFSKTPSHHMTHNILQYIFHWDETRFRGGDAQRLSVLDRYQKDDYDLCEDHLWYLEKSLGMLAMYKPDLFNDHLDRVEEKHKAVLNARKRISIGFQNYPEMSRTLQ